MRSLYNRTSRTFQSTLPTRGSNKCPCGAFTTHNYFNPRSPRGGATRLNAESHIASNISIHAPHEGEQPWYPDPSNIIKRFQSTLPTRGSNPAMPRLTCQRFHFNPRSPRWGATLPGLESRRALFLISIHAPHDGERRLRYAGQYRPAWISIHAPHDGERRMARMMP